MAYQAGQSLLQLAWAFRIHRRTVAAHLEQRGVAIRTTKRKLSDRDVTEAARRYVDGDSLVILGEALGVSPDTVRRELHQAGVALRSRHGR